MNVGHQKKRRGKGEVTKERNKNNNNNNKTKQNKNTKHHFICFDAWWSCNNRVSVVAVPISNIIKCNLSSDSISFLFSRRDWYKPCMKCPPLYIYIYIYIYIIYIFAPLGNNSLRANQMVAGTRPYWGGF